MKKKQLIIAAMALALSVSAANATSTISNITTGGSGTFNIDPAQINGDVGYRYYDQFQLGQGDIANLIYQGLKNGSTRNIESFINLVRDQIDVQGVLNTVRNDAFYNGHAVFISPKGMVVGASGVLNVGTLSVVTPTDDKFSKLKTDYNAGTFEVINNISQLRNGSGMNHGGNADVDIKGTVIARNGVDIRGSQVNVSGNILNAYNGTEMFSNATAAQTLFNNLVNTDGITASASQISSDGGRIVIKSGAGTAAGIDISGKVANLNTNESAITNHGDNGLQVSGLVANNGKLNVYNNNTTGALTVSGNLVNKNAALSVTSKGSLNVKNTGKLTTDNALEVVNHNGKLTLAGEAISAGKTDIVNYGNGGMEISGTVGNSATPTVRIANEGGKLVFTGKAVADESVSVRSDNGMNIGGTIKAGEGILVHNKGGNATLSGNLTVDDGNVAVYNQGTGKLTTTSANKISTNSGNVAIKNEATGGMELNGTIKNEGQVAINNLAGAAVVNGEINNTGNIGIINKENGTGLTVGATINNEGKIKLVNSTGANGLTVDGTVNNSNGNLYVYNDAGQATINGTLANTESGNLYVLSRAASTGIKTDTNSTISNDAGNLVIKHNGSGSNGIDLNGTITNDGGETAINNYNGDLHVAGSIDAKGDNLGIINRAGGNTMLVEATVETGSNDVNIKNYGSGDMTVNGEINHAGRLNVLGNKGNVILGGTINNTGKDMTYVAARANGDGIVVKDTFNGTSNNGGLILIKNITGQNGLTYEGTMTTTNGGQAEVYNKVGDMTVTGAINATPAVVLNTGDKLTVTDAANLQGTVNIVNKGSEAADVASKYKSNFRESLNK